MREKGRVVLFGFVLSAIFVAASVASPSPASAQTKKDPKPALAKVDVGGAVQKIKSGDEAQIRAGFDDVRIGGPGAAAAAPAIAEALARGLSLSLTEAAIDTLADLESEAGSSVLAQYAAHRSVKLRRAAVKALTRTKGAPASVALRRALADADAVVRGTAASGLGALRAKDAVPDLFVALDHRVNEAAASIGQLCNAEQCEALAAKLGKVPFDVVTGGLDPILFRKADDVSDDGKIKVIGRMRELGTQEANRFLKDVQKRWPKEGSSRVRQAIDQAVAATGGSKASASGGTP